MTTPRYAPYKDGNPGFNIALAPLALSDWIEVDDGLLARLALKDELFASRFGDVFAAEAGSLPAQDEVWRLLLHHVIDHFPDRYSTASEGVALTDGALVARDPELPLLSASRLVDEDLCLMVRHPDGWRFDAASLCFPSHWRLAEKIGRPMADIHAPVPGFAGKMAERVTRIFDHLRPEAPVWRLNWSLHDDPDLFVLNSLGRERFEGDESHAIQRKASMRIERQTLRKLPETGAILFTIRTYIDPIKTLRAQAPHLLPEIAEALTAMTEAQLDYKGLTNTRDQVVRALSDSYP